MNQPNFVASTTEPALSLDASGTILDWNDGATKLFGFTKAQVLNKRCWEVLSGCDQFGNEYCGEGCPLIRMAVRHNAISRCELCYHTASLESIRVGVSTMVFPGHDDSELMIVHLFTPLGTESASPQELTSDLLTKREIDVLRLLSFGKGTPDIADVLTISEATVRNHIHQILHKLKAHNRLEAVCVAWRMGLIEHVEDKAFR